MFLSIICGLWQKFHFTSLQIPYKHIIICGGRLEFYSNLKLPTFIGLQTMVTTMDSNKTRGNRVWALRFIFFFKLFASYFYTLIYLQLIITYYAIFIMFCRYIFQTSAIHFILLEFYTSIRIIIYFII